MLARVENTHWWYRTRERELVRWARTVPKSSRILDVGSAVGGHVRALGGLGFQVESLELSTWAVEYQRSLGIAVTQGDARSLPWPDASFDAVICLDVLEHIGQDVDVARELRRVLAPEGRFLVTVPEDATLWSAHDEAVGHVRRYEKAQIVSLLEGAGLEVESIWSTNVLLKPVARFRRRFSTGSDLDEVSRIQNLIGWVAFVMENALQLRRLGGMTIWVAGHAPAAN